MAESKHLTHPKYRADIDGLRAIAVLSVVSFHAFPNWVKGGFVGVDIFFVISGFLISSIILSSLRKDTFSFGEFYARRIKRIFPALILVMTACYIFGWFALLPDEYKQLSKHIAAGAGFVSNFFFWQEAGYFDNLAGTKPLLHLWSLGIEEQFYIVWPVLLFLAWKWRFNFLIVATAIVAISFSVNVGKVHTDAVQTFYSPLPRFWELLMGSILAYLALQKINLWDKTIQSLRAAMGKVSTAPTSDVPLLHNARSVLGVLLIGIAILLVTKESAFPGWWALLPTLGACLIISAGKHAWLNRTLLSNRVMVWFGLISYPFYLWHWPLLSFAQIMESRIPSIGIRLAAIAIAIVLAWLTYRLIEHPLRIGKQGSSKVLALSLLMVVLAGLGYGTYVQDGLKHRVPDQILAQADSVGLAKHWSVWSPCGNDVESSDCRILNPDKPPEIALLGDSHAMQFTFAIEDIYGPLGKNIIARAKPGCSPFFEGVADGVVHTACNGFMDKALNDVMASSTIRTVILGNYGVMKIQGGNWLSHRNNPSESNLNGNAAAYKEALYFTLKRLVDAGKNVIFMVDVADLYFVPEACIAIRPIYLPSHKMVTPCAVCRDEFDERNFDYHRIVNLARRDFPKVKFIDSYEYFCDEKLCRAVIDGELLYRDNNHLNVAGAHYLAKKIAKQLLN